MINRFDWKRMRMLDGERIEMLNGKIKRLCVTRDIIRKNCPEQENVKKLKDELFEARRKIKQLQADNMDLRLKAKKFFGENK